MPDHEQDCEVLDAEEAISGSGLPFTIVRAAQFHSLVLTMTQKLTALPVVPLPGLRLQPVDGREVAARLAELTLGTPAGRVPDVVGPQVHTMGELIRGYLRASGKRRPTLPVRLPGKAGRAYRDGANLTLRGATVGSRTWEAFLAEQVTAVR